MKKTAKKFLCVALSATLAVGMMPSMSWAAEAADDAEQQAIEQQADDQATEDVEAAEPEATLEVVTQEAAPTKAAPAATMMDVTDTATPIALGVTKSLTTNPDDKAYYKFTAAEAGIYLVSVTTDSAYYPNCDLCVDGLFDEKKMDKNYDNNKFVLVKSTSKTNYTTAQVSAGETIYIRAFQTGKTSLKTVKTKVTKCQNNIGKNISSSKTSVTNNMYYANDMSESDVHFAGETLSAEDFGVCYNYGNPLVPGVDYEISDVTAYTDCEEIECSQPVPGKFQLPVAEWYEVNLQGIGGFTGSTIVLISGDESIDYSFHSEKPVYFAKPSNVLQVLDTIKFISNDKNKSMVWGPSEIELSEIYCDEDSDYWHTRAGIEEGEVVEPGIYNACFLREYDTGHGGYGPADYWMYATLIVSPSTPGPKCYSAFFPNNSDPYFLDEKYVASDPVVFYAYNPYWGEMVDYYEAGDMLNGEPLLMDPSQYTVLGYKEIIGNSETVDEWGNYTETPIYGEVMMDQPNKPGTWACFIQSNEDPSVVWTTDVWVDDTFSAGVTNLSDMFYSNVSTGLKSCYSRSTLSNLDTTLKVKIRGTWKTVPADAVTFSVSVVKVDEDTQVNHTTTYTADQVRNDEAAKDAIIYASNHRDEGYIVYAEFKGNIQKNYGGTWGAMIEAFEDGDINTWTFDGDKPTKTYPAHLIHALPIYSPQKTYTGKKATYSFRIQNPKTKKYYTQASSKVHVAWEQIGDGDGNMLDEPIPMTSTPINAGDYRMRITVDGFSGEIVRTFVVNKVSQSSSLKFSTSKTTTSYSKSVTYSSTAAKSVPLYVKSKKGPSTPEFFLDDIEAKSPATNEWLWDQIDQGYEPFIVNDNGTITVAPGTKKGTYYLWVSMYIPDTDNYNSGYFYHKLTITVK